MCFSKQYHETFIPPFNLTIPKNSQIENLDSSKYNFQSFDSTFDKTFVGNGRLFYFYYEGRLYLYYMVKRRYSVILKKSSVLFISYTELNWKTSSVNGLCISFLLNNMGWYLGVIGKIHNDECLIYMIKGKVEMVLQLFLIKKRIILGINN